MLGYQWYHVPDSSKEKSLSEFLEKLGFDFTEEEVTRVVRLKRKPGQRPERNIRQKRMKLK